MLPPALTYCACSESLLITTCMMHLILILLRAPLDASVLQLGGSRLRHVQADAASFSAPPRAYSLLCADLALAPLKSLAILRRLLSLSPSSIPAASLLDASASSPPLHRAAIFDRVVWAIKFV